MEWVDANLGSKLTMKYPSCYLLGPGAHGEILSMAFAGPGQHQDAGGKVIHFAPHTSSKVHFQVNQAGVRGAPHTVACSKCIKAPTMSNPTWFVTLFFWTIRHAPTHIPNEIDEDDVTIGHEASVSKVAKSSYST